MNHPGLLIALEGSDGAGKSTQLKLLAAKLRAEGRKVTTISFPRYAHGSSYFVRQYLAGKYGPAADVSPYTASLFYALDRYAAATQIEGHLKAGKIVLADRYVGSNMAHQGSKFSSNAQKRGFFIWAENLEYETLKVPRPDLNLYLHLPLNIAKARIVTRSQKTAAAADEHEKDTGHLKNTVATYQLLCELFSKDYIKINCADNSRQLKPKDVSEAIWQQVRPLLK